MRGKPRILLVIIMRSRTAFTLAKEFRVVIGVNAQDIKLGDIITVEKHGHLPLRAWYRRGLIVPAGSRYDHMFLAKHNAKHSEKIEGEKPEDKEPEIVETEDTQQELIPAVEIEPVKPVKAIKPKRGGRAK